MKALVLGIVLLSACAEAKPNPTKPAAAVKPAPKKSPAKQPPPAECHLLNGRGEVVRVPCK